jgi:hypothetical protein
MKFWGAQAAYAPQIYTRASSDLTHVFITQR